MFLDLSNSRQAHIDERLRTDAVIWLNSVRPDGKPHAVVVWYLWDGEHFLIFSKPKNQKIRNLSHNANVLLAVDNSKDGSDPITIEGTAELLDTPTSQLMNEAYLQKYLPRMQSMGWTADVMAGMYSQAIRITPIKLL
jgi:PPOX class probable F420-dependent enzyme